MQLLYTPIAGYVHTVEALINYAGLRDRIEPVATKPFDATTPLPAVNPIGKVPTLVLDDGEALYGGPVIYEYLDSLHQRPPLFPPMGRQRYTVLRRAWLADALFDTFVQLIIEGWLYPDRIRQEHVDRCWNKLQAMLDQMETDCRMHDTLDIAQLRGVGALSFIDLKMAQVGEQLAGLDPSYDWRTGRPRLAGWYVALSAEPLFREPLLPA
jgi:glutathione S-transferase